MNVMCSPTHSTQHTAHSQHEDARTAHTPFEENPEDSCKAAIFVDVADTVPAARGAALLFSVELWGVAPYNRHAVLHTQF